MRTAAVIALVAVLVLSGCGQDERPAGPPQPPRGDFGPVEPGRGERPRPVAPPEVKPAAAVAGALAAGTVGVVGVDGRIGVRPRALAVSGGGRLRGVRWERWDDSGAWGRGLLRLRDCDPTCATGGIDELPATIALSGPRLCGRATYFDRAEVSIPDAAPPATYVRAPC